jgi:glycosyltransferase involved in cell wall biosynthesis
MQVVYSLFQAGSERVACDLAMRVDPSRLRSSVCALALGGPLAETLKAAAIPSYVVGCEPGLQWRVIRKLYRLFRDTRVDLVQTHHFKQLFYSGIGARLAGAALVHVEHEYFSLQAPKIKRYLRAMGMLCHRIVTVGDEVKEFLVRDVRLPRSKVSVISNGVDVEFYVPRPRIAREALGLRPNGRLIGHVARLEAEKDQASLLHAFRTVSHVYPDARLVMVGDGSRRDELQCLAAALGIIERVDFLGSRKDVAELLPHLDVFVLSSLNEGLPLSILEAMACARPVVATAVGEVPLVVRDGVTGLTVPPGDSMALARAVMVLLEQRAWATAMGRAARQLIEDNFSLARTVGHYEALYESLLPRSEN